MPPQQQQDDDFSQYKVQPGGEEDFSQYKAEQPPAPSRLGEIGSGIWRGLKSIPEGIGEAAKPRNDEEVQYGPTGRVLLHMGQDFMGGLERGKEARDKSKASGEGWAGQTLSTLENYPVIGGMVKHAELGGPHMFSPESLGAAAEGSTLAAAPEIGKRLAKFAPEAARATVRGAVKGANKVLEKAPGTIGATVGAGVGGFMGGPAAATAGGAMGLEIGREVLPKVKIPGENFGRPKPQLDLFQKEPALVRGGRALGRKIGDVGRGLVGDETEAEALHDTIAHGDPIGKPLAGHSAGAPSDQPLPVDPKFTETGEKLAVEFPKPKPEPVEIAGPSEPAAQPAPAKALPQSYIKAKLREAAAKAAKEAEPKAPTQPVKPARPYSTPDAVEDRGIRETMQEDLDTHGRNAWREFSREHAPAPKGSLVDAARNAQYGEKLADLPATSIGSPMRPLSYPNGMEVFKQSGAWYARGDVFGSDSWKQVTERDIRSALRSQEQSASPESANDLTTRLGRSVQQLGKKKVKPSASTPTE